PRPATLPCPKIAHTPGMRRRRTPSRSLYWAARNLTTAWPTVALTFGIWAYAYHTTVAVMWGPLAVDRLRRRRRGRRGGRRRSGGAPRSALGGAARSWTAAQSSAAPATPALATGRRATSTSSGRQATKPSMAIAV